MVIVHLNGKIHLNILAGCHCCRLVSSFIIFRTYWIVNCAFNYYLKFLTCQFYLSLKSTWGPQTQKNKQTNTKSLNVIYISFKFAYQPTHLLTVMTPGLCKTKVVFTPQDYKIHIFIMMLRYNARSDWLRERALSEYQFLIFAAAFWQTHTEKTIYLPY